MVLELPDIAHLFHPGTLTQYGKDQTGRQQTQQYTEGVEPQAGAIRGDQQLGKQQPEDNQLGSHRHTDKAWLAAIGFGFMVFEYKRHAGLLAQRNAGIIPAAPSRVQTHVAKPPASAVWQPLPRAVPGSRASPGKGR